MDINLKILFGLLVFAFLLCILGALNDYFHRYRADEVYKLRVGLLDDESMEISERLEIYRKLPSFDKMVYSFKPIRLETWYKKEEQCIQR